MLTVQQIADYCEEKVPGALALGFDNVGLLCGFPHREVSRVLVALDATLDVIEEACRLDAQLIVTHHPIIFSSMKQVLSNDPTGRRVISVLQNGLSVISLHTNLDTVDGGVNTQLADALGLRDLSPLDIGRMGSLPAPMSFAEFTESIRTSLQVSGMRGMNADRPVHRVAVCGGSGGDLVGAAAAAGCDTLVTGEVHHHQWLDARELGINLIEADHFCTEAVVLPALAQLLLDADPCLEVLVTQTQTQPSCGI